MIHLPSFAVLGGQLRECVFSFRGSIWHPARKGQKGLESPGAPAVWCCDPPIGTREGGNGSFGKDTICAVT